MAIVDGTLEVTVSRDALLAAIDRANGPKIEFTEESLADAIHGAFCEGQRFAPGLRGEIHRRQHLEIARAIIAKKGANS